MNISHLPRTFYFRFTSALEMVLGRRNRRDIHVGVSRLLDLGAIVDRVLPAPQVSGPLTDRGSVVLILYSCFAWP